MFYVLNNSKTLEKVETGSTSGLGSSLMVQLSTSRISINDYDIECALEMVVHIHRINEINLGLKQIGSRKSIDVEIYHRMLQYIIDATKPLSPSERLRLFTEQKKIWELSFNMRQLDMDSLPLAKEIGIMSFGIHANERELLENERFWQELVDNYYMCWNLLINRNIELERFDEMFETIVESTRKGYSKERERRENPSS
ncbi:MAG: hypothetical protein AAF090_16165 [Bacteroidota bacterium]